jgi:outer membrane protein assembly factor BamB
VALYGGRVYMGALDGRLVALDAATGEKVWDVRVPEPMTRTPNAMPARGAKADLSGEESRLISAYVWAISQTRGEPWPGGHVTHGADTAQAAQPGRPD